MVFLNTQYLYNLDSENISTQLYYYERLKSNINSTIKYLKDSISSLDGIKDSLNSLTINDSKVENVTGVKNDIKNRVNYLNNIVIPSINKKINSLKNLPM